jgi:hypothetical protein
MDRARHVAGQIGFGLTIKTATERGFATNAVLKPVMGSPWS